MECRCRNTVAIVIFLDRRLVLVMAAGQHDASMLVHYSQCGFISPVNQTTTTLLRRRPSNDLQSTESSFTS